MEEWMYRSTIIDLGPTGGGEWSALRPDLFTPGRIAPYTHWIAGGVGPRARLDTGEERNLLPFRESNPDRPVAIPTELSRFLIIIG
jgi:hypothetical protein